MMGPWADHRGRLSPLKLTIFVLLFIPGLYVALAYALDGLGPRPLNEAIHQFGLWTIRLILVSLAVTPTRQILQWGNLVVVRRMIGVAAFCYGIAHLSLYVTDQAFDLEKVGSEIILRFYLAIGFVALLGLAALAATSTDGMVRRLGARRWQRLHHAVYSIAILAIIHYFIQSKLDVYEPTYFAGFFGWLMGYRLIARSRRDRRVPLWSVAALGVVAAALTGLGEAIYFWAKMGVDPLRVLRADLSLAIGIRPAWIVLATAAAITLLAMVRSLVARQSKSRLRAA
jgi:sulfoxide reductase heme-binding subunit YedZ